MFAVEMLFWLNTMTLSGKYQQYNYPDLESKANGISNFAEEDSLNDDCATFLAVCMYCCGLQVTLGIMVILGVWAADFVCLPTHRENLLVTGFMFAKVKSFIKIWTLEIYKNLIYMWLQIQTYITLFLIQLNHSESET